MCILGWWEREKIAEVCVLGWWGERDREAVVYIR